MDIRSLKYFIEVVQQRSFTKASKNLYISQPMLTKSIKQLEDELGVLLIDRSHKYFVLTEAGTMLYKNACDLCLRFDDIYKMIHDIKELSVGTVSLAIPSILLNTFFPEILHIFRRKHPGIRFDITEVGSKDAVKRVLDGEGSVGFIMLPIKDSEQFKIKVVASDYCVMVCHNSHPLAKRESVTLSDLKNEHMVLFNDQYTLHDVVVKSCNQLGFVPKILHTSSLESFVLNMVTLQEGITIMPRPLMRRQSLDNLVTIPIVPFIPWEPAFIIHKDRYVSFATKAFIEFSLEFIQSNSKFFFGNESTISTNLGESNFLSK